MITQIGKVHQFAITGNHKRLLRLTAFENGMDDGQKMRAVYQTRRDLLLEGLTSRFTQGVLTGHSNDDKIPATESR